MNKSRKMKFIIKAINETLTHCLLTSHAQPAAKFHNRTLFSTLKFDKVEFLKKLGQRLNLDLAPQTLWEYPNIDAYAVYIVELTGLLQLPTTDYIRHHHLQKQEPIAIIGMGCRFPGGVSNIEEFWELMLSGRDPISEIPINRWDINDFYDEDYQVSGKMNSRYGGFVNDVDLFDAAFFNISPKEARQMDPQQRLFLEVAWQAIEQGALQPEQLKQTSTGVFVGVSMHDYERLQMKSTTHEQIDAYTNLGSASSAIGARLSYFLGLNGPSFAIDTACSSSMSALYHACLSLRSGECDLTLAGGVNLILDPDPTISYSKAHMMASDGRCKTFDEQADGYVRSEGCGVVILKQLDKAIADGNQIFAVIRSTVANQDGSSNGITAPNMLAQAQMLHDGLYCADLKPDDIDFFETHGTGTFIGDPIEVDAINRVYATQQRANPLYLGAVKSQIGHCEAAAGIAGVLKTALALYHQKIPANLHFNQLNQAININKVPCAIPTSVMSFSPNQLRLAAVSSYGFTGTNTHAILEQAPIAKPRNSSAEPPKVWPFMLSAKNPHSLQNLIQSYRAYLTHTTDTLGDICYTLAVGRSHFNSRLCLSVCSIEDLLEQLNQPELPIHEVKVNEIKYRSKELSQLIKAYWAGKDVCWSDYYAPYVGALRTISLPTYCFDKQRYWIDTKKSKPLGYGVSLHELLGARLPGYGNEIRFLNVLRPSEPDYIKSHAVFGDVIVPGAGFIESALAAGTVVLGEVSLVLTEMNLLKPLRLSSEVACEYQVSLMPVAKGYEGRIDAHSQKELDWDEYATFLLAAAVDEITPAVIDVASLPKGKTVQDIQFVYDQLAGLGLDYGTEFQVLREVYVAAHEAFVLVELPKGVSEIGYCVHPALLDGAFQTVAYLMREQGTYIPSYVTALTCTQALGRRVWMEVRLLEVEARQVRAEVVFYDEQGVVVAELNGFRARATDKSSFKMLLGQKSAAEVYVEVLEPYLMPAIGVSGEPVVLYASDSLSFEMPTGWSLMHSLEVDWSGQHVVVVYDRDLESLVALAQRALKVLPLSMTLISVKAFGVGDEEVVPHQREALGFWRTFAQEAGGGLRCLVLDIESLAQLSSLVDLIGSNALEEPEIIVRAGQYYVPRLYREAEALSLAQQLSAPTGGQYLASSGGIDTLHWAERAEQSLGRGQVRVRIAATALNFRDVLNAMDLYPGDAGALGCECSGVVLAVGSEVVGLSVGDRVVVLGEGLFGGQVVVDARSVCGLPGNVSLAAGASIPIVFLTANYGLNELAQLKAGQKVLIHAASGGVGLAAIAFAQAVGAQVYATASRSKWAYLEAMGITHIYDSRSTEFGAAILEQTAGAGVDVVLNSLTSEGFIAASLLCLKAGGVFLEIGKLNRYSVAQMQEARADVAYHIIEIDTRLREEPERVQEELAHLLSLFAQEQLKPLMRNEFAVSETLAAFHYLQQAKHVGKVVVLNPEPFEYQAKGSYLITGGSGGLGLALAGHLVEQGAGQIVLTSRSGASASLVSWMAQQQQKGVDVRHYAVDVADERGLAQVFKAIKKSGYPLKGIFHAAGVLHDGLLMNLSAADFRDVLAPKVIGSQNLDRLSRGEALDCFVLFSSVTSLLGSAGQANYTAANAYMDGLAQARRQQGLAALAINWGPFAAVGMAAGLVALHKAQGLLPLDAEPAFALMERLLAAPVGAQAGVMHMDWRRVGSVNRFYLSHLVSSERVVEGEWSRLLEVTPAGQRSAVLMGKIKQVLGAVLSSSEPQNIEVTKGFFEMGLDSLMAVDLKNKIQQHLVGAVHLTNTLAFDYGTVQLMSDYLLEQLHFKEKVVAPLRSVSDEAIAIIGLSAEVPGAGSAAEFWRLMSEGREGVSDIPKSRWDVDAYYDANPEALGKMSTRRGGFIREIEQFDGAFFGISPKEATYLDPQQRLLLTHTWRALEDAGIAPGGLLGSDTGVFIGIASHDYSDLITRYGSAEAINAYIGTGNALSTASGRISYTLGLEGPNLAIDTACSSSLVALNEACERLARGECRMAIVGGVNALLTPEPFINFSKAGMLSADGRCKTFDESANGYARGEGCGIVIVKRLSDALADNDRVLAVVKGSGINQDGASSGLTVPNGRAQERLLTQVLAKAGLVANDIDYVECHGTGTRLGDPIEVGALGQVYGKNRSRPLYLGSVKTNIGHLEAAAGIVGLIKTVLSLNEEQLPVHLNFHHLNTHIQMDFAGEIVTQRHPWARSGVPRRAGVSSFGFSGTNAHVIVEEAPVARARDAGIVLPEVYLFVVSAKSQASLEALVAQYGHYLATSSVPLGDICYTAATGRSHFAHRLALIVRSKEDLVAQLSGKQPVLIDKDLEAVRDAYLKGEDIDWLGYYAPYVTALRKVSVPTYCFDTQRYWLAYAKKDADINWHNFSKWCFEQVWEGITPNASLHHHPILGETLIIACQANILSSWQFVENAHFVLHDGQLKKGTNKDGVVHLNFNDRKQVTLFFKEHTYQQVLILCHADSKQDVPEQSYQWMKLLLSLTQSVPLQSSLLVITENAQVLHDDLLQNTASLALAPIIGFVKSLQLERPELNARLIDVGSLLDDVGNRALLSDLSSMPNNEVILVSRGQKYVVPRVSKKGFAAAGEYEVNSSGTYLITGGLGALGQIVAQWLINQGAKHLVLLGRHDPGEAVQQNISQWVRDKIEVRVELVDLGDKLSLSRVLGCIHDLRGIFHLAGVSHQAYIAEMNGKDVELALKAKVAGGYYLHELTQSLPLDCFVLFSSVSAFIGAQKQSIYSAANQFLDQLALYRQSQGLHAVSIGWGPWAEVGMVNQLFDETQFKKINLSASDFIHKNQAMAFLSQILSNPKSTNTAFVSPHYLRFMLDFMFQPLPAWVKGIKSQLPQPKLIEAADTQLLINRLKFLTEEERKNELQSIVRAAAAGVLGVENPEQLNAVQGFFEMGMDSLMAVELQKYLQQHIGNGVELKANIGFDYPTIQAISDYLYEQLFGTGDIRLFNRMTTAPNEPIAVIGMNCRFPGHANSPELLWDLLASGRDGVTEVPKSRWNMDYYYDADPAQPGKSYTRKGGFIDDIELFDPAFFNISPREAEAMDPQQRMLLEVSYVALERSGYSLESLKGTLGGVFIGVTANEYGAQLGQFSALEHLNVYYATGGALNVIAGRLSYTYGLEGPSEIVDTACSSSLVALHNAIQALRNGDCTFAIVGGVNAMIRPETFVMLSKANMLAPDGYCKTFDEKADGYARGEGCGVIILKRLCDAKRDNDTILAVIRGSGVNQDGASSGLTVPRGTAQQAVIERALTNAQVKAEDIDYVEAHGTGTSLGDPIEVEALSKVYGIAHQERPFSLGTVKTNIGHLESAAGIAGVIKVILSLQHREIPPHLHFNQLNPHIDLASTHAQLPLTLMPWTLAGTIRRAAVSSFGFSGTNAHVIIEEYPVVAMDNSSECGDWVLRLSARTPEALAQLIEDYVHHIETHPEQSIQDIVFTSNTGRTQFEHKALFSAATRELLLENLKNKKTSTKVENTPKYANKIVLPTYPFERQRYWLVQQSIESTLLSQVSSHTHPFLVRKMEFPETQQVIFETDVTPVWPEFVPDHLIYGQPVIAGATYLSSLISAIEQLHESKQAKISQVEFIQPIVLDVNTPDKRTIRMQIKEGETLYSCKVLGFKEAKSEHIVHFQGQYELEQAYLPALNESLDSIKTRCPFVYKGTDHMQRTQEMSLQLGPHFNWIEHIHYSEHELLAKMRLPDAVESARYLLYPGFIDSCFQTILVWLGQDTNLLSIPLAIQSFSYDVSGRKPEYVYIRLSESSHLNGTGMVPVDLYLLDKQGKVVGFVERFESRAVPKVALMNSLAKQNQLKQDDNYYVEYWQKHPIPEEPRAEQAPLLLASSVLLFSLMDSSLFKQMNRLFLAEPIPVLCVSTLKDFVSTLVNDNDVNFSDLFFFFSDEHEGQNSSAAYHSVMNNVLLITQSIIRHHWDKPPRLWIVTQDGCLILPHDELKLSLSGIPGFFKTLAQEHPEFPLRLVDLDRACVEEDNGRQASHLLSRWKHAVTYSQDKESVLAYREEDCYVMRLMHWDEKKRLDQYRDVPKEAPYHLTFERGILSSMRFESFTPSTTLPPDWVELEIEAAALNFRDVLNVQGMYPGDAGEAGGDCCGLVTRLGQDVTRFKVGDRVFGMSSGTFASHAVGPADWLVHCPKLLSAAEACTLPAVFITSYVSLIGLAQLTAEDTVLIHAASGGVGLAAIQIAQHVGATIIATAGSARKRAYLKQLGVHHVFDSRTFDYVDSINNLTHNQGVDVVLNFLVDEFIEQTLRVTKEKGRFIEIGKRAVYSKEKMHEVRPDVRYNLYALDDMMRTHPEKIRATLALLAKGLTQGIYRAIPYTEFSLTRIVSAFNYMRSAQHIGKVVVVPVRALWPIMHPDEAIVLIGGLGGIGYTLAKECLQRGAKQLLLIGRKSLSQEMKLRLDELYRLEPEASIEYISLDISNKQETIQFFSDMKNRKCGIQVVFNTAGVLVDATLKKLTLERIRQVSLSKVDGTWNVYQALTSLGQTHIPIISFSSIASILGSGGQAHYAAANSFLNAFAAFCQQRHQLALSIAWGAWADVGMAKDLTTRHARGGMNAIKPQNGMKAVQWLLDSFDVPPTVAVAEINWSKLNWVNKPAFLDYVMPKARVDEDNLVVYLQKFPSEQRVTVLQDRIRELAAAVMGMSEEAIPVDKGFFDLGMDSLMAVELKNQLQVQVGTDHVLHSTLIFDSPNIEKLAEEIGYRLNIEPINKKMDHGEDSIKQNVHDLIESNELDAIRAIIQGNDDEK